jgi:hypothetical protein
MYITIIIHQYLVNILQNFDTIRQVCVSLFTLYFAEKEK